jgi:hypothetical protein
MPTPAQGEHLVTLAGELAGGLLAGGLVQAPGEAPRRGQGVLGDGRGRHRAAAAGQGDLRGPQVRPGQVGDPGLGVMRPCQARGAGREALGDRLADQQHLSLGEDIRQRAGAGRSGTA